MTVEAETAAAAFDVAWQAVTRAEPFKPDEVLHLEVQRQADMQADLERGFNQAAQG